MPQRSEYVNKNGFHHRQKVLDVSINRFGAQRTIIVFLVLIFGIFYFLLIRPQRKRQKEHEQLVRELQRGDSVLTAGGIFGVVESISEESVVIKVESGATLRVAKGSVALKREKDKGF